jgi:membrane fusion protein
VLAAAFLSSYLCHTFYGGISFSCHFLSVILISLPGKFTSPGFVDKNLLKNQNSVVGARIITRGGNVLFREEVLKHRQTKWLGSIHLAQPISTRLAVLAAAFLATALALFVLIAHYTRTVRVSGNLEPAAGALKVVAVSGGTVVERRVREGAMVSEGAILFTLSSERHSGTGPMEALLAQQVIERRQALERERNARRKQDAIRQQALAERISTMQAEDEQLRREVHTHAQRMSLARSGLERLQKLADKGFVPALQIQQKEQEFLEQQGHARALERSRLTLSRERAAIVAQSAEIRAGREAEEAQFDRQLTALAAEALEQDQKRSHVIRAAKAGMVAGIAVTPGQAVDAGTILATLVPQGTELEAHLYAPSRAVGFVRPGQPVLIRYAAFPYQHYGLQRGLVQEVSRTPTSSGRSQTEALYRLIVRLDAQTVAARGERHGLKPGMVLEAEIAQEKRRLIDWFVAPLIAAKARFET